MELEEIIKKTTEAEKILSVCKKSKMKTNRCVTSVLKLKEIGELENLEEINESIIDFANRVDDKLERIDTKLLEISRRIGKRGVC